MSPERVVIGDAELWLGDCREVLPTLAPARIDCIWTDPPYGHNNNNGDLIHNWEKALGIHAKPGRTEPRPIANDGEEATPLVAWMFEQAARLLKPGGCCCCCCGGGGPDPQFARWSLLLDDAVGFKHAVVWDKGGLGMGWHYRRNYEFLLIGQKPGAACKWYGGNDVPNVWRIPGIKPQANDHPTPKPVLLIERSLTLHTLPGDVVLDPFMGGGTTGVACANLGRKFIGVELERRWFDIACERIENAQRQARLFA